MRKFSRWARVARDADPDNPTGGGGTSPEPKNEPATGTDKGFPENTPVADMTAEQQAKYWQHQARKHEDRAKKALSPQEAAELKRKADEFDKLQKEQMSELERAQAERDAIRKELQTERSKRIQREALDAAKLSLDWLENITATEPEAAKAQAESIKAKLEAAGAQKNNGSGPQQGYVRGGSPQGGSVAAGRDLYAERNKTKN